MFFKNNACPIAAAADMQYCAAQGLKFKKIIYK